MKCACEKVNIKGFSKILKTISEETRLKILCYLKKDKRCVCELSKQFNAPHNLILHHLTKLKKVKIVNSKRKGKYTFYYIDGNVLLSFLKNFRLIFGKRR